MFSLRVNDQLELRLYDDFDADTQYQVIADNRDYLSEFLSWPQRHTSVERWRDFIADARGWFAEGSAISTAIYHEGKFVGSVGLSQRKVEPKIGEIGYWIAQSASGRGIITQAVKAILDYGFGILGYQRIYIRCATINPKSCAVAERLGFQYEATLRSEVKPQDQFQDIKVYGMLAHEWTLPDTLPEFEMRVDDDIALRLVEPRHAEALFALVDRNRAHLQRYLPWVIDETSPEDTRIFIGSALRQYADREGFQTGIWYRGTFVGMIGYHKWNLHNLNVEIGYWLDEAHQGLGIMTRAARFLTDYAFRIVGLKRVQICCAISNSRSCAIPKRLGFQHEGTLRQTEWLGDRCEDLHVYAMLADEWHGGS